MKHTVGVAVWRGLAVGQMEPRNLFNENFVDSYPRNLSSAKLRRYTVNANMKHHYRQYILYTHLWLVKFVYPIYAVENLCEKCHFTKTVYKLEQLHLTLKAVKHLFIIFCFTHKNARQESSKFYSDLRNASSLELTEYYFFTHLRTSVTVVQLPCRLN